MHLRSKGLPSKAYIAVVGGKTILDDLLAGLKSGKNVEGALAEVSLIHDGRVVEVLAHSRNLPVDEQSWV